MFHFDLLLALFLAWIVDLWTIINVSIFFFLWIFICLAVNHLKVQIMHRLSKERYSLLTFHKTKISRVFVTLCFLVLLLLFKNAIIHWFLIIQFIKFGFHFFSSDIWFVTLLESAGCWVHLLLSLYSLCGVLPAGRAHRFVSFSFSVYF